MSRRFFFLLAFIEGASVMAAELLGAKMLSPQFGSSLYVWATVMAITLGGLALGYFAGGLISAKRKSPVTLYAVLLVGSAFVILMPFLSKTVIYIFGSYNLTFSIIFCTLVFLFPPVFMMGMVSPLIISLLTRNVEEAGKVSGAVYAISTAGGIIATFLTGFWIIPEFGLTMPCIITGIILGALPLFMLIKRFKVGAGIWLLVSGYCIFKAFSPELQPGIPVLYNEEGLMGQILVVDYPVGDSTGNLKGFNRTLFVNRMTQAQLNKADDSSMYFGYIEMIMLMTQNYPIDSKVLICGMGGGGLANKMSSKGYEVDVCEIDPRIYEVAATYFELSPKVNVFLDDARHFIKTCGKKYDILVLDVFKGEEIPSHCFTVEAFAEIEQVLTKTGALIINGNGYLDGKEGLGSRSIAKTLEAAGYSVCLLPTSSEEDWSNIEYLAIPGTSAVKLMPGTIEGCMDAGKDGVIMTDDKPILDVLNAHAYKAWRELSINYFTGEMTRGRYFPLFK